MSGHPPRVRAVLHHAGRFLLVQHNNKRPENIGKWGTPGGGVEPGDPDLVEALRREMREEFEIEIDVHEFVQTYEYHKREHHVFLASPARTNFILDPEEILDYRWLTVEEIRAWDAAGRLHTGFELDAVERSLRLLAADQD
ncbi:MAG: NUDIX hydrolase [Anaerolineae bacterium]|nr:NUDIX hydrolase [Anaerolineae bacterium]